jgi:hypothetical protein
LSKKFDGIGGATGPVIVRQPKGQTAALGSTATFDVEAVGAEPLQYQWLFKGAELAGATDSVLELLGVTPADAGSYQVIVSNVEGSVTSDAALLQVAPEHFTASISCDPAARVHVFWTAARDKTYSVWAASSVVDSFSVVAADLWFPGGLGLYEEPTEDSQARFYQICSP